MSKSEFFKNLHEKARVARETLKELYGEEYVQRFKYSDFLSYNKNPVFKDVKVIMGSFQFTYVSYTVTGEIYNELRTGDPETFIIYTSKPYTTREIYDRVEDAVLDAESNTGVKLHSNVIKAIKSKNMLNIEVNEPRGLEEVENKSELLRRMSPKELRELITYGVSVKGLDSYRLKNKNYKSQMKINLLHFFKA